MPCADDVHLDYQKFADKTTLKLLQEASFCGVDVEKVLEPIRGKLLSAIIEQKLLPKSREHVLHGPPIVKGVIGELLPKGREHVLHGPPIVKGVIGEDGNPVTGLRHFVVDLPLGMVPGDPVTIAIPPGFPGAGQLVTYTVPQGLSGGQKLMCPLRFERENAEPVKPKSEKRTTDLHGHNTRHRKRERIEST